MTIDDVANELGISKTTVSRAISGKGRVSPKTREMVLGYIETHNFKPNAMARGLAKQKTYNIGVVCPTDYEIFDFPFFHMCLRGISEVTSARGYDILISMVDGSNLTNLRRIVEDRKVDGVILTRTIFNDPLAEYLKETEFPFVVIGSSPDESLIQIDNDHLQGCAELTSVLIRMGCRRLALIGCDEQQVITDTRRRGFLKAFEQAGLSKDQAMIYMDAISSQRVAAIVDEVLSKKADGIICMDEKIAGMVIRTCRLRGVEIPRDIRLASFYDSEFLTASVPAVTALDIDDRHLGTVAAQTLLSLIKGGHPGSQKLKNYQIILRESTS